MPRYAILEHHFNGIHWDFLLENGNSLLTWALEQYPDANKIITAQKSADHRLIYLDYEGEISNNRGHVVQWDSGEFNWIKQTENHIEISLGGKKLNGTVKLDNKDGEWGFSYLTSYQEPQK